MKGIKIKFNDEIRRLKYDTDAYHKINEKLGKTWTKEIIEQKQKTLDNKKLSILLWGGLIHEDPKLNLAEVELAIGRTNPKNIKKLHKVIELALFRFSRTINKEKKRHKKN